MDEELKNQVVLASYNDDVISPQDFQEGADFGYHLRDQEVEKLRKALQVPPISSYKEQLIELRASHDRLVEALTNLIHVTEGLRCGPKEIKATIRQGFNKAYLKADEALTQASKI